jgi:hypothetical protein
MYAQLSLIFDVYAFVVKDRAIQTMVLFSLAYMLPQVDFHNFTFVSTVIYVLLSLSFINYNAFPKFRTKILYRCIMTIHIIFISAFILWDYDTNKISVSGESRLYAKNLQEFRH